MRSLESRIITLFILFFLGVQVAGFISLQRAQESKARSTMELELANAEQAILRLLDQQTTTLTDSVMKLASDNHFIRAVLTDHSNDRRKQESVLAEHTSMLGGDMAWLVGADGRIQAATSHQLSAQLKKVSTDLVAHAEHQDYASALAINNHIPMQLIATLLRTTTTEVWVVMAFPLEKNLIAEIEKVTSLAATVLVKNKQHWQVVSSNLSNPQAHVLAKHIPEAISPGAKKLMMNDTEYSVQMVPLVHEPVHHLSQPAAQAVVVMQGSISDMLAPYSKLQIGLIVMTLLGLILAVYGNITFVKHISQPLRQLRDIAKRLGGGDYASPIQVSGDEGIRDLAQTFVSMRDDIANREREIKRLAYWDTLTELPNRAQFIDLLKAAIDTTAATASTADSQSCFVLLMDLDRFKHVNDVMGHTFGDLLLKKVAKRLSESLPDSQLARLGGDEFALLLPNSTLAAAEEAALIILTLLEHPFTIEDQAVDLGAGIGLAGYPAHGENAETLMSHAEVAMYAAKRKVGSNYTVYSTEIDRSSHENLSLLSELRTAIEQNQLRLFVQPKYSLDKRAVVGVEALMRWIHPTRGFLMPDQFIPFAEQTGIIRQLTRWMLDKSAALCAELQAKGINIKVSVNISTHDLLDQDLPVKFADILRRHRVKTGSFCLEITESAIMNDPKRAELTLDRLHVMGVELAIDDFGTGYSSLAYLKKLPVTELKIDRSFVIQMEHNEGDKKIVKSTIDLGHNMGLNVVAEGVESAAVMTMLAKMGCDQAQGNYINSPIPAEQLVSWLDQSETLLFS